MRKEKDWKLSRHGKLGGGKNMHARVQEMAGEGTNSESTAETPMARGRREQRGQEFAKKDETNPK
jgi:hypothetical protein